MTSNKTKLGLGRIQPTGSSHPISNGLSLLQHSGAMTAGREDVSVTRSIAEWIILAGILVQLAKSGMPEYHQ